MLYKYKHGDVVKYSEDGKLYILVIKKRYFKKNTSDFFQHKYYNGIAVPLEKIKESPCRIILKTKKELCSRIFLEDIKEKHLLVINSNEIDMDNFLGKCI